MSATAATKAKSPRLSEKDIKDLEFGLSDVHLEKLLNRDAKELIDRLELIVRKYQGVVESQYGEIRKTYCAIQLALNHKYAAREDGVPPHGFRPRLTYCWTPEGLACSLSNDTQVIDMHMLHCLGIKEVRSSHSVEAMSGKQFNYDSAYRFARTVGTGNVKLKDLGIDGIQHVEIRLASLKRKKIRSLERALRSKFRTTKSALVARSSTNHNVLGNEQVWAQIACADWLRERLGFEDKPQQLKEMLWAWTGTTRFESRQLKLKLSSARKWIR